MDVVIAGGHGQIAMHLERLLSVRGDRVRGLIRNTAQAADLRAAGAEPVLCDLEGSDTEAVARAVAGADAIVFAAGAGPGSGPERKRTMDLGGALKSIEAAELAGVERYVMIGAMGTDDPPPGDEGMAPYLRAKAEADRALMASGLRWTIARPGRLTNDRPDGEVLLARHVDRAEIPRAEVAAVLVAVLDEPRTAGHVFEVVDGPVPIAEAIEALVDG
jgi:uncharacterized protein YbjT (DUF2867 family)